MSLLHSQKRCSKCGEFCEVENGKSKCCKAPVKIEK